jgi:hypothetical protein
MTKNRKRGMCGSELEEWIDSQYHIDDNGCWIWNLARSSQGYGAVKVNGKMEYLHQRSLERKIGRKLQKGEVTRHICPNSPNRSCHNPEHLELGSQADNVADTVRGGRHIHGEKAANASGRAVLTKEQIIEIRAQRDLKSGKELAEEYGVSSAQISRIQLNQRWVYVHQILSSS